MKVSSKGEYTLRALIVLGQKNERMSVSNISEATLVTVKDLEKMLPCVKKLEYVERKRGIHGDITCAKKRKKLLSAK